MKRAALEQLSEHVHHLQEREGLRSIRLNRAAIDGLHRLQEMIERPKAEATPAPAVRREPMTPSRRTQPAEAKPLPPRANREATAPAKASAASTHVVAAPGLPVTGSSKVEQLAHLAARAADCQKCPHLAARRHHVVFGVGSAEAELMFIGEAPGEEEDLQGEPFIGRAGQLLTKMIVAMGLTRETIYIANIVKCRPDLPVGVSGNRKPTRAEMETCVPYLRAQIDVIQPRVLVALGASAVEGLLGPVGTIGTLRGKFLEYRGIPLMPTYHPSYLLRNGSNTEKRKVWDDLLKVMDRMALPISDKQRGYFLGPNKTA